MQTLSATDCVGSFDLVFIDADKGRYPEYYELALALTRKGGVIALDNVLRRGNVVREWRRSQTAEAVAVEATAQEGVAPVEAVAEDEMLTSARILDRLNFKVSQDTRVQHCLLPVGDGLLLATKL
jgi:predicted O-methyltransferase YrrM